MNQIDLPKNKNSKRPKDRRNRSLRMLSAAMTIVFIVVILIANVLFETQLGDRLKWDWSSGNYYTIGTVTREILHDLKKDVEIIGLFDSADTTSYGDIRLLLKAYEEQGGGKVLVRYIDSVKNPDIIKQLDPDGYLKPQANTFVVYCPQTKKAKSVAYNDLFAITADSATGQEAVTGVIAEQSLTGAIRFVTADKTPMIYFSTGHNEDAYDQSYTTLATVLKNNNYDVRTLDLLGASAIPSDCTVIVMLDPKKDLTAVESNLMSVWLKKGGSLFVLSNFGTEGFAVLNALLSDYQIAMTTDHIREGNVRYRYQSTDAYTLRAIVPQSPLTIQAVDGWTLVFQARRIEQSAGQKPGVTVTPVLTTSTEGVSEINGKIDQSSQPGTQIIGLMAEDLRSTTDGTGSRPTRILVIGSAAFLADDVLKNFGTQIYNANLFYESVSWLAGTNTEDDLFIEPKALPSFAISTGNAGTYALTVVFVLILIPGLLLLLALRGYQRRRHL